MLPCPHQADCFALPAAGCALALVALAPKTAAAASAQDQQELVDRATLAVGEVLSDREGQQARNLLPQAQRRHDLAHASFAPAFLFGGEGGGCALVARAGQGSWSSPAFYAMGGGSFGLQIGIQDAEIVMMILTDVGLRAVMDSQFRLGADASVALVTIGAARRRCDHRRA